MIDIDTTFFSPVTEKRPVERGGLLVAQPFLEESWFRRGVISLIDYSESEGATGVVLNNGINYVLDDVLDDVEKGTDIPVYCGGPLSQDRLYFVHTLGSNILPGARQYAPGLYIGGDFDAAVQYINEGYPTDGLIRFFIGYSGWESGQLEQEIADGTWATLPAPADPRSALTGDGYHFWHRAVRRLGSAYRSWRLVPGITDAN